MAPHMICVLPYLNSNAQVRHLRISVPLVAVSDGLVLEQSVTGNITAPRGYKARADGRASR